MEVHVITQDGARRHPVEELPALLARDDALVWVDIPHCDAEAERVLADVFGLHPTVIRECVNRNRIPKTHSYPEHVFVVLHAPERGAHGHVHYVELDQVIGRNYLITVHGPVNPAVHPEAVLRETVSVLTRLVTGQLHPTSSLELSDAIVSALSHRLEDYIEAVTSDAWQLEQRVTGGQIDNPEEFLNDLFRTRHGLLAVRTMAALNAAVYEHMAAVPGIVAEHRPLVATVADEFGRILAVADGEREYLQGVIEFYQTTLTIKATLVMRTQNTRIQGLTEASYAQSEQVKKISAWAAIFFAPTFIGTVYGMNFDHMPELHWILGYPFALLVMALVSAALYLVFKRQHWL